MSRFHLSIYDYVHYCRHQQDASPIYIFDAGFGERLPRMVEDYKVSNYFQQDYLSLLDVKQRPPYRWFVMGPARSGASWHVDPAGTSAWNTLISGRKRWALYPNNIVPPGVQIINVQEAISQSPTSLLWYQDIYPTLPPDLRPLECIQEAGQTIFVPGGWWHMVLNLNETVAITQNFADDHNLEIVCSELSEDPKLFKAFQNVVGQAHPHLKSFLSKFDDDTKPGDAIMKAEGFEHRSAFTTSFTDLSLWTPRCELAITKLQQQQQQLSTIHSDGLPSLPFTLKALSTGQNPVFTINEQWIIKYYAHLAAGHPAYNIESTVLNQLTNHPLLKHRIPFLLIHGHLRDTADTKKDSDPSKDPLEIPWSWPFIVYRPLDGTPLQPILLEDKEELIDWSQVLPWLAQTLSALHVKPLFLTDTPTITPEPTLSTDTSFRHYLLSLGKHCQLRHQTWRHLPSWLIDDIPQYIAPLMHWLEHGTVTTPSSSSSSSSSPRSTVVMTLDQVDQWLSRGQWIHGDLNAANLLGHFSTSPFTSEEINSNHPNMSSDWQLSGLIDFADARPWADPLWDLVPLHISVFGGNGALFHQFLQYYRTQVPKHFLDDTLDYKGHYSQPSTVRSSSKTKRRPLWQRRHLKTSFIPQPTITATSLRYPFPLTYILTCYLLLWPFEGVIRWMVSVRSELCVHRQLKQLAHALWSSEHE